MCENKMLFKKFDIAIENRKLEIELLWKRSLIFWGFISALFISISSLMDKAKDSSLLPILSLTGLVFSVIWTLANRGSKAWQESWEVRAQDFYKNLYEEENIYGKKKAQQNDIVVLLRSRDYSVSRLLIALSDFSVIVWTGISLFYFPIKYVSNFIISHKPLFIIIFYIITVAYIVYVFKCCKSRKTLDSDS